MPAELRYTGTILTAAAAAAADGQDCTHCSVWDAAGSGTPPTGGNFLWAFSLSNDPDPLALGGKLQGAASAVVQYDQPEASGETNYLSERKVDGMVTGGLHLQFHTGAPGAAGTLNVISLARVHLPVAGFESTRT